MRIKHIDKIAREKSRDVVQVSFEPETNNRLLSMPAPNHYYIEYENDVNRKEFISWLDENNIAWEACGHVASESGFMAYSGNIYLEVPFDEANPLYIKVAERLENPDGTFKNPRVKFWLCTLEQSMENAHHDEPGFWDKWAETF